MNKFDVLAHTSLVDKVNEMDIALALLDVIKAYNPEQAKALKKQIDKKIKEFYSDDYQGNEFTASTSIVKVVILEKISIISNTLDELGNMLTNYDKISDVFEDMNDSVRLVDMDAIPFSMSIDEVAFAWKHYRNLLAEFAMKAKNKGELYAKSKTTT